MNIPVSEDWSRILCCFNQLSQEICVIHMMLGAHSALVYTVFFSCGFPSLELANYFSWGCPPPPALTCQFLVLLSFALSSSILRVLLIDLSPSDSSHLSCRQQIWVSNALLCISIQMIHQHLKFSSYNINLLSFLPRPPGPDLKTN